MGVKLASPFEGRIYTEGVRGRELRKVAGPKRAEVSVHQEITQ
jgi:hypothetical protein